MNQNADEQPDELDDELDSSESGSSDGDLSDGDLSDSGSAMAPGRMVYSFMVVGSAFCLFVTFLALLYVVLLLLIQPAGFDEWAKHPDEFNKTIQNSPELIWPDSMSVLLVPIVTLAALGLGYLVALFSQFSQTGHAGILALVCFVTLLQYSISNNVAPRWVFFSLMVTVPIAILIGCQYRVRQIQTNAN